MNLYSGLKRLEDEGRAIKVGLIGAGKFGSMFLAQVPATPGLDVAVILDLQPDRAKAACITVGWPDTLIEKTRFTDDPGDFFVAGEIDIVVEATGDPRAGLGHAQQAIENGKHIVMVNVEADVLAGPLLAKHARDAGLIYSLAYGDQPALIAELVDWARASGFAVTAAGKGTKYLPEYHKSTPETVWRHYGLSAEQADDAGMNAQMFNSFLDGTKSAIEMTAVANATGLSAPENGLLFPPCGVGDLASRMIPKSDGGLMDKGGQVEVVSCLERNGTEIPQDLRWGVYVVIEAPGDYAAACFAQYGLTAGKCGNYAATYKPFHLIGLELNISIASAILRGEPTGCPAAFTADAIAIAKTDLKPGNVLDGEGGFTVWGKLTTSSCSLAHNALPIGLADGVSLRNPVKQGNIITMDDVKFNRDCPARQLRLEMIAAH